MASEKSVRRVSFCPHCGNKAPQRLLYSHCYAARCYNGAGDLEEVDERSPFLNHYFVVCCETCYDLLLYHVEFEMETHEETFRSADLRWPSPGTLDKCVPSEVADCYAAAVRVRAHSPDAFAGQVRRALEAICNDQGECEGQLHGRLGKLAKRGILPQNLGDLAIELKDVLNVGAHAGSGRIKDIHVSVLGRLFLLVVDYIYGAPGRLQELRDKLKQYPLTS